MRSTDNIILLQKVDESQKQIADITSFYWRYYAKKHGYMYYLDDTSYDLDKSKLWMKWKAVRKTFEIVNEGAWIFWSDIDTLPMNMQFSLEDIIPNDAYIYLVVSTYTAHSNFIITSIGEVIDTRRITPDENYPQVTVYSGSFLIKNTPWSRNFVKCMYEDDRIRNLPDIKYNKISDEIGCQIHIFGNPCNRNQVKFINKNIWFTIPYNNNSNSNIKKYTDGDFIIHAFGMSLSEKISTLCYYKDKIIWK